MLSSGASRRNVLSAIIIDTVAITPRQEGDKICAICTMSRLLHPQTKSQKCTKSRHSKAQATQRNATQQTENKTKQSPTCTRKHHTKLPLSALGHLNAARAFVPADLASSAAALALPNDTCCLSDERAASPASLLTSSARDLTMSALPLAACLSSAVFSTCFFCGGGGQGGGGAKGNAMRKRVSRANTSV